jgi:hypothetical protein
MPLSGNDESFGRTGAVLRASRIDLEHVDVRECRADQIARGHALLTSRCCHAVGRDGESTHPQALPFRIVVTRYPPKHLAEALAEGIVSGHPDMPEFIFAPQEVSAIIAYLHTLNGVASEPLEEHWLSHAGHHSYMLACGMPHPGCAMEAVERGKVRFWPLASGI